MTEDGAIAASRESKIKSIQEDLKRRQEKQNVLALKVLFPHTNLFVLPLQPGIVNYAALHSSETGPCPLDWSAVETAHQLAILSVLEKGKLWSYIADCTGTWLPLLDKLPVLSQLESDLLERVITLRCNALLALKRYEEALVLFRELASEEPKNDLARNDVGFVLQLLGRHEEAIPEFDRAIELCHSTEVATFLHNRALSYAECGKFERALEDINQIAPPLSASTQRMKAQILKNLDRRAEAMVAYEEALSRDDDNGTTLNDMACAFLDQMNYPKALELLDKALSIEREGSLMYNRGRVLYEMGRIDEARQAFDEVLKLNPTDPAAYFRRAVCHQKLGREADASRDYEQVLQLPCVLGCDYNARGYALLYFNRGLEAYEHFQKALFNRPLAAEYIYGRARSHLARGLIEDAWADACKAVQLKPMPEFIEGKKQIEAMRTPKLSLRM